MHRFAFLNGILAAIALLLSFSYCFQCFEERLSYEPVRYIDVQCDRPTIKYIELIGAVKRPGKVAILTYPPRLFEAVENAGGFTEEANIDVLNLSEDLTNAKIVSVPTKIEQELKIIYEPVKVEPKKNLKKQKKKAKKAKKKHKKTKNKLKRILLRPNSIPVNTASKEQLKFLPGVGNKISERIIQKRNIKPIKSDADMLSVKGIGKKKLLKMRPYLTY